MNVILYTFNVHFIIILSQVGVGIPTGFFPSGFPTKILCSFLIPTTMLHFP